MISLIPQVLRNERNMCCLFFLLVFSYYITMDIMTYVTIQNSTFTDHSRGETYSIFNHLSAKLVMLDHTNHYVFFPTAVLFDKITRFSKVFFFITPNMVTITHFILALVAAKLVSSENLRTRRIAVILYEFRIWLDNLDGVIYRSHANDPVYKSNKSTLGYAIDVCSDVLGGVAFNLGVLFFLFKVTPNISYSQRNILPCCRPSSTENGSTKVNDGKTCVKASKKLMFWKAWCFGFLIFIASGSWDMRTEEIGAVLETILDTPSQTALQTSMLHSFSTWVVMYLWRLCSGQSLFQFYLIIIFMDKVWEFLNFVQYVGYVILLAVNIITVVHINHMKTVIGIK